jgi:hypothetical protein
MLVELSGESGGGELLGKVYSPFSFSETSHEA